MKRERNKKRNGLVQAMILRHSGRTCMKDRREKRQGNSKNSWKGGL